MSEVGGSDQATANGSAAGGSGVPTVSLSVPADGAFLSIVRTTTAGVAARLDLTLDEIEDLRIAVDEAGALLLASAIAGTVDVRFELGPQELVITLSAHTGSAPAPDETGFGWTVLAALAGSVHAVTADGRTAIVLTHALPVPA